MYIYIYINNDVQSNSKYKFLVYIDIIVYLFNLIMITRIIIINLHFIQDYFLTEFNNYFRQIINFSKK